MERLHFFEVNKERRSEWRPCAIADVQFHDIVRLDERHEYYFSAEQGLVVLQIEGR